jgi:membrane associated rhomboid family serine protease
LGIYDRDYERQDQWRPGAGGGGFQLRLPESMVNRIVLVTVVAYLIEVVFFNGPPGPRGERANSLIPILGLQPEWWRHPWQAYQLFTYALVHDNNSIWHVVGNMFGVWMFGRQLEARYGGREFLLFYLGAVLFGGLAITLYDLFAEGGLTIGASAGTVAVIVLFALLYPRREVLLYFAIPVPMWLVGAFIVGMDVMRALGSGDQSVSFQGHLGGAAFAVLYFTQGLRLSDWLPRDLSLSSLKPKPELRVHHGGDELGDDDPTDTLAAEVDRILGKINEQGQGSLTGKEKRLLERASREYKGRKRL